MKSIFTGLMILAAALVAGSIVYLNRPTAPPTPAPAVEPASSQAAEPAISEKSDAPTSSVPPAGTVPADGPPPATTGPTTAAVASGNGAAGIHSPAVDALLAAKNGAEKNALFQQLLKSGLMDQAIAELKQRAADNPNDAEILVTLGEAQIHQVGAIHAAGGDLNEQGILAMQADQSFNAALKIDPANYEAQLVKSISMTYWPADAARDAQVVQTLSSLIDRQETMPSQPDFAQAYIYLGNEYQKIGQPEKAAATWQLGLQKFPGDATLQKKVSGQ